VITPSRSNGTLAQEETSETTVENASMFTVDQTPTTDMLSSGTATTVSTKPGSLTKPTSTGENNHFQMAEDSN